MFRSLIENVVSIRLIKKKKKTQFKISSKTVGQRSTLKYSWNIEFSTLLLNIFLKSFVNYVCIENVIEF